MKLPSVMISCVQRRDERRTTLSELEPIVGPVVVIESRCDPAGGPLNRLAAYAALQQIPNGGLFFEDDVSVSTAEHLTWCVTEFVSRDEVSTFFVPRRRSIHPQEVLTDMERGGPLPRRVLPLRNTRERRGFYGTQAMYFPAWFVRKALEARDSFVSLDGYALQGCHGFDFFVKENADVILGAFPNPIQHRNPPKMTRVSRGVGGDSGMAHTSLSFGL